MSPESPSDEFPAPDDVDPEGDPGGDPAGPEIDGEHVLFDCATCGKNLRTLRTRGGQTTNCPQCGDPVTVPETGVTDPAGEPRPVGGGDPRTCPMCGAENPAGAARCATCGERLPEDPIVRGDRPDRRFKRRVGTVGFGQTFSDGWALFTKHFGLFLGGSLLTGLLLMLIGCLVGAPFQLGGAFVGGQFEGRVGRPDAFSVLAMTALNQIGQLLGLAVASFLLAGFVRMRLNLARRDRAEINELFEERGVWASAALCTVVYTIVTTLPGAFTWAIASAGDGGMNLIGLQPITQPTPAGPVTIFDFDPLWAAVTAAVQLGQAIVAVFFWPYLFLCVDYRMNGFAPLTASVEVTRGSRWNLFWLSVVQGLVGFACLFTCGIAFIAALPWICALNIAAYEQISGNHAARRRAWEEGTA